jgi:zinc/manganese transport system substrate-binding protein
MASARRILIAWMVLALCALAPASAGERLRCVATIPDLADIVREVGGERVEVTSLARGPENLHAFVSRPSHLVAVAKADALFQVGLSLETAFVPALIEGSRNLAVFPGAKGFINCSEGWQAIQVPVVLTRQAGDVHPQGNPHMNLDPRAGRFLAARVLAGLASLQPASKEYFEARHAAYLARLEVAEKRWAEIGAHFKGKQIVEYHQEFDYFLDVYGVVRVANLEVKPGIPPTPNHLAAVIEKMKAAKCEVILTAPWSNNSFVARVADATGAKVLVLPTACGGVEGADTWIELMDHVHERLARAFGAPLSSPKRDSAADGR